MLLRCFARSTAAILAAGLVLALTAGTAAANRGGYPPSAATLTATPPVVDGGETVEVCGSDFTENAAVTIEVSVGTTKVDTVTANSDGQGAFCVNYTAPDNPGETLRFDADDGVCQASAEVQIRVPTQVGGTQATNSPNLAFTGRTLGPVALLGGVLVVAGAAFWFLGQRRSPEAS